MIVNDYLNQTVSWKRRTGVDDWNSPTFAAAVTLPARVEERRRRVTTSAGSEIVVATIVTVAREIFVGDQINVTDTDPDNYYEVQTRETEGPDLDGEIEGWRALL